MCLHLPWQVNEDLDHRTLLRRYERELKRLRAELQQRSRDLVDRRLVLQVGRRPTAEEIAAFAPQPATMHARRRCQQPLHAPARLRRPGGGSRPTRLLQ